MTLQNEGWTLEDLFKDHPMLCDPATVANALVNLFGRDGYTDLVTPFGTLRINVDAESEAVHETPDPPDGI